MESKELGESTVVLVFDSGDEVVEELLGWAAGAGVSAATFSGIGAVSEAEIGFFDLGSKEYKRLPVLEQVEVLSINGNITLSEGSPRVHAHVVLSREDGSAIGGHLFSARVKPTLEVFLTRVPGELKRTTDSDSGLPLIDPL